jgi:hypothetical protein
MPYLTVLPLAQFDFDPCCGAVGSDRLGSRRQVRVWDEAGFGWKSPVVFELYPAFELNQFILCWVAFDHHPVGFFDVMFWVGQSFDESPIIGKQ